MDDETQWRVRLFLYPEPGSCRKSNWTKKGTITAPETALCLLGLIELLPKYSANLV